MSVNLIHQQSDGIIKQDKNKLSSGAITLNSGGRPAGIYTVVYRSFTEYGTGKLVILGM